MVKTEKQSQRLESLDVLRGFDLFCLVALEIIVHPLQQAINAPWFDSIMWGFNHIEWQGFSPWDLVMPLFMFMAGVSIPFSLSRYQESSEKFSVYRRIIKRILLLWLFGMICQGNLLALDPNRVYLYSNTLQAIAMGYLITAMLFLHVKKIPTQIIIAFILLIAYWCIMQFVSVDGYGKGNYTPNGNLAEWVDRVVLGRFRDQATVVDGEVQFSKWYQYTWILSSINFGVTVMTGLFAGQLLKSDKPSIKKVMYLFIAGIIMVIAGWLWNFQMPVVKKIWTSSMVLVSSGYCFLLMGLFYYWIDYKNHRKYNTWLKVYGMNSILAYMLCMVIDFDSVSHSLFHGLEQYIDAYYPVLLAISKAGIIFVILYILYKRKLFLRV